MSIPPHETAVHDAGDLRKYRTEIPNLVFLLGLTPFELALYSHLKRVAGAHVGGKCFQATATLARETGMSEGMVSKAKQGLIRVDRKGLRGKPLIRVDEEEGAPGRARHVITITDIWRENFHHFVRQELPQEVPESDTENSTELPPEDGLFAPQQSSPHELQSSQQSSPHELKNKKDSSKKELSEEGTEESTPQPPAAAPHDAAQACPASLVGWGAGWENETSFLMTDRRQAEALLRRFGETDVMWQVRALVRRGKQGPRIHHPWDYLTKRLRENKPLSQSVAFEREMAERPARPGAPPEPATSAAPPTLRKPLPQPLPDRDDVPPWRAAYHALPDREKERLRQAARSALGTDNPVRVLEYAREMFCQKWNGGQNAQEGAYT